MPNTNGRNAKLIKIHNRALVLKIIQQNGSISRKDIAALTGLTQATITKITRDLLDQGLIVEQDVEQEPEQTGASYGRKPIGLAINREKYKIISVHIGRHALRGAIFDLAGNLLHTSACHINVITEESTVLTQDIIHCIQNLLSLSQIDLQDVLGIGIAAPGPINAQKGIMRGVSEERRGNQHLAPFDWREIPLKEALQKEFDVNVFADNCANVSALAESWFGNGIGVNNFVLYSIGAGIGAGVIIDGMLYRGEDDVVSEIGHITINFNGPECICGNIGCLEFYGGFANIVEEYEESNQKKLSEDRLDRTSKIEALFRAADQDDSAAFQLIKQRAKFLGIGAVSLANIFSPECIIVASNDLGEVDLSLIVEELQDWIERRAFSVIADKVHVIQSRLKSDIHLYGGVALVLQDFFQVLPTEGAHEL